MRANEAGKQAHRIINGIERLCMHACMHGLSVELRKIWCMSRRAAKCKTYDNLQSQMCGRGDMVVVYSVQNERATHEGNINFS